MPNSFFHFKSFSILAQEKGLRVTTDACLLGAIADALNKTQLLDIGTGTGVVAMFMAQRFPHLSIDAIDIEETIIDQALINIQNSPFKEQIALHTADILNWNPNRLYDTIVCNPPYFKNHLEKTASEKNTAIHANRMDHHLLIKKVSQILKNDGKFYCILPPYEMTQLIDMANDTLLFAVEKISIFNQPGKHYRDIVCFSHQKTTQINTILLLNDENGNRTDAFSRLMHDFYLEDTQIYKKNKQ